MISESNQIITHLLHPIYRVNLLKIQHTRKSSCNNMMSAFRKMYYTIYISIDISKRNRKIYSIYTKCTNKKSMWHRNVPVPNSRFNLYIPCPACCRQLWCRLKIGIHGDNLSPQSHIVYRVPQNSVYQMFHEKKKTICHPDWIITSMRTTMALYPVYFFKLRIVHIMSV